MDELTSVKQDGWTLPAVLICILSLSTLAATVSLVALRTVKMQQIVTVDSNAHHELSRRLAKGAELAMSSNCAEVVIQTPLAPWRRLLCRESPRMFTVFGSHSPRALTLDWDYLEHQATPCAGVREALSQVAFYRPLAPSTCTLRRGTYPFLTLKENISAIEPITVRASDGLLVTIASPGAISLGSLSLESDTIVVSGGDISIQHIEALAKARCLTLVSVDGDIKVSSTNRSSTSSPIYITAMGRRQMIIPPGTHTSSLCKEPRSRSASFRGLSRD